MLRRRHLAIVMRAGLIAWLLLGVGACACFPEREFAKMQPAQRRATEALVSRNDPDSLAAAALFTARRSPAEALALIERATAAAPERPELAHLQVVICARTTGCDPEPFEAHLRKLDPANGIGWIGALTRAYEADDEVALDAALVALGRSERVDSYFTIRLNRLSRAIANVGTMPLLDAIMNVLGESAANEDPGYRAVSKGCSLERLERPAVREVCRSLAASMMAGDTLITEMVGVGIAKRSWPADSPQWKAASEARRVYRYRSEALTKTVWITEWDEAIAAKYLDLMAQHRREQDVLRAQLVSLGIDPIPPPDWVDPSSQ